MNFLNSISFVLVFLTLSFFGGCNSIPSPGEQVFISDGYSNEVVDGTGFTYRETSIPIIFFLQGGNAVSPNPRTCKEDGPVMILLSILNTH